jgi:hypothetical protein
MAGPSAMAESQADAWSLSPSEAGEVLAERSADFAAPVPTAEQVQDAYDARLRLTSLTNDPAWAKRFMEGSIPERREFEALTQTIANADEAGAESVVGSPPIETTIGSESIRRQDWVAEIAHLSKVGIPEAGIVRTLTGDFSEADIEWAQGWLDKGMATKEWTDALLRGDPTVLHEWTALCAVVSAGKSA